MDFASTDLVDPESTMKVGALLGADYLLMTHISMYQKGKIDIQTKLVESGTGKVVYTTRKASDVQYFQMDLGDWQRKMVKDLSPVR
jgi:hypothetical protein